jgi:Double-GTPase 2
MAIPPFSSPSAEVEEKPTLPAGSPGLVRLNQGIAVRPEETADIMTKWQTRLVVLAGGSGSGRTTLMAALYQAFHRDHFADYDFAGSQTLPGLEALSYRARVESALRAPNVGRTLPRGGQAFFHLLLKDRRRETPVRSLLVSILPGEVFEAITDSYERLKELAFLRRADIFAIVLDGARLGSSVERHGCATSARLVLRACLDSGHVEPARIQLLTTKWDRVSAADYAASSYVRQVEAELKGLAQRHGHDPAVIHTASLSKVLEVVPRHGLAELLRSWFPDGGSTSPEPRDVMSPRLFDHFGLKNG